MSFKKTPKKKLKWPFAPLEHDFLASRAYRELSPNAAKVYPHMKLQAGINASNGKKDFAFTYRDAIELGFARATFSRALKDLISKGLINQTKYGGKRGFCLSENCFALSERWRDYGTDKFEAIPRYDLNKLKGDGYI